MTVRHDYDRVETGNFPDFANIPFVAELFVKDRWPIVKELSGAAQYQMGL